MFGIGVVLEPGLSFATRHQSAREARVVSRQVGPGGLQVADANPRRRSEDLPAFFSLCVARDRRLETRVQKTSPPI